MKPASAGKQQVVELHPEQVPDDEEPTRRTTPSAVEEARQRVGPQVRQPARSQSKAVRHGRFRACGFSRGSGGTTFGMPRSPSACRAVVGRSRAVAQHDGFAARRRGASLGGCGATHSGCVATRDGDQVRVRRDEDRDDDAPTAAQRDEPPAPIRRRGAWRVIASSSAERRAGRPRGSCDPATLSRPSQAGIQPCRPSWMVRNSVAASPP